MSNEITERELKNLKALVEQFAQEQVDAEMCADPYTMSLIHSGREIVRKLEGSR